MKNEYHGNTSSKYPYHPGVSSHDMRTPLDSVTSTFTPSPQDIMSFQPGKEEAPSVPKPVTSISSIFGLSIRDLTTLIRTLSSQDRSTDLVPSLQEELGRLRIWAGNFGAQWEETDEQSLDYTLKDAPDLRHEVIDHFYDLGEAIQEGTLHSTREAFVNSI